jgi:uncharacterized LabA/DUF88 family protein
VEYLKYNQGKQVEVLAFGQTTSARLKESVDDFVDMSEEKGKFLIFDRRQVLRPAGRPVMRAKKY